MAQSPNISANKGFGDAELQLVVFNIHDEEFGVEIDTVQEIIRMINITEIPRAPPYVKGLINLRGRIIVVINLSTIMRVGSNEPDANTRIIVADVDGTVMGFIVDSVSEVIRLSAKSIEPTPSIITNKIRSEYIKGVGKINERLLILLNLNKMLSSEELIHIQNMSSEIAEVAAT
ncbi:MAG: chemotaxis protein CheW [Euryarchaeota archaeon]|nr:chemotaxis protein CheW [Euryarchaeota archaeon]